MTAKRVAERALEEGQTQALIGADLQMLRVFLEALTLIQKYGNAIPPFGDEERA